MPDLPRCLYCKEPASKLLFYSKQYPSGKSTIEAPIFTCEKCSQNALKDLSICRGGIEGVRAYTFKQLGAMKEKEIAHLTSKRGWEINHLGQKEYRQLLFSIHYRNRPSRKDILRESLVWYQKVIEKENPESSLLESIRIIQESLNEPH